MIALRRLPRVWRFSASVAVIALLVAVLLIATRKPASAEPFLNQGLPVLASSVEQAHFAAERAVDGDTSTRWSSAFSDPQWIRVDLGSVMSIGRVELSWERAYAKAFEVQTSDDGNAWKTVYATTNGTGGKQSIAVTTQARYVRMYGTVRATQYGYSLWEFQVHEPGGVTPQTPAPDAAPTTTPGLSTGGAPGPTGTPPVPTAGGWVPVDAAEQAARTAAFFALTPSPVTGNPVKVPEFHATCLISHHGNDDPIVFPGKPGASHNHTFFGNTTTNASSTAASLAGATTTSCNPREDKSAYWIPTLYQNGQVVDPLEVTVYYGSRLKDPSKTQPFPPGLRMITGDATKQSDPNGNHFWCAGIGGEVGRTANGEFPVCAPTAHLVRQVTFFDCWDGKHLDSPNHKDHMANGNYLGVCPATHPVPIPSVSFVIGYPLSTHTEGIRLSSGTGFSMHADFFNAWDADALAARVRNCLDQGVKCNAAGGF